MKNLITIVTMLLSFVFSAAAQESVLPVNTVEVTDDFNDGDFAGWTVDDLADWEVKEGIMQMSKPVDYNGTKWQSYFAVNDEGEINGDFTISLDIGFNIAAYPLEEDSGFDGDGMHRRNFAFGIRQDEHIALLSSISGDHGIKNGILVTTVDESNYTSLYHPYTGQGVRQDIHDLRSWKMSRSGSVVTVWADDYQWTETSG